MSTGSDFPEPSGPPIVVVMDDPVVQGRLERVARDMAVILVLCRDVATCRELPGPPRALIVDVRLPGALDAMPKWKAEFPEVPLVGVVRVPDPNLWSEAESAGADLVITHGAIHRRLPGFLDEFAHRPRGRRVRVAPLNDFEGKLGYIGRIEDDVPEEIALYHVGYEIHATSNACPHAGARLSDGELSEAVITCPRHGSQFDVTTGERLRGPADDPIKSYPVVVDGGIVYIEIEDAPS